MGSAAPGRENAGSSRKKILIIDDSQIALLVAGEALENAGYEVNLILYPAETREPLMNIVNRFQPDLVLSDVDMPLLRGDQFVKVLRSMSSLAHIKVYFHSSVGTEELAHHVLTTKADGYIQKSSDISLLVKKVKEVLG